MSDAILGLVALGYSPVIDRKRAVTATRLTVFPLRQDAPLDAAQLLQAVAGVWPGGGGGVMLNVASEALLRDLLAAEFPAHVALEVPAFMAGDPAHMDALKAQRQRGAALRLKGRPIDPLPPDVLACFAQALVDGAEGGAAPGGLPAIAAGVHSVADMDAAFARGAVAVTGWPMDDLVPETASKAKPAGQTDLQVIVELINRVDRQEPIDRLEGTLKRDPSLAFKLMRYINSPAFGLSVEIGSFRHAIMMLGYQRLKRWLALLLATASKDTNFKPVMFAAVRRGLVMEELARSSSDEEMRNEMFICGVFSLLDRMFRQPFDELLRTIPVPQRVFQALVEGGGPYAPYLELVRSVEAESLFDFRSAADALMMGVGEINRAQLRALTSAAQLD